MLYDQAQLAALYADGYQVKKKNSVKPFLTEKNNNKAVPEEKKRKKLLMILAGETALKFEYYCV